MEATDEFRIYNDENKFKGNTFEDNINSINKLCLGQGIKIANTPFIYTKEQDKKSYLGAYYIKIDNKENNESKIVCYPTSFLFKIFYYNNFIFYLDTNDNKLILFELREDSIYKYEIQKNPNLPKGGNKENNIGQKNKPKIQRTSKKYNKNKIDEILQKLEKMKAYNNINKIYEELIFIVQNDLNESLRDKKPKNFNGAYKYEIEYEESQYGTKEKQEGIDLQKNVQEKLYHKFKFEFSFILYEYQIDDTGIIRKKVELNCEKISLENGIKRICQYINAKDKKQKKLDILNNTFKCPIIYKNFEENNIPANTAIIYEIKSGFDIDQLLTQIENRIKLIRDCMFWDGEEPKYFIGIVNLLSENVNKINKSIKDNINCKENILIIGSVDYNYWGIDVSSEFHNDNMLYQKIIDVNEKIDKLNEKMDLKNRKVEQNNELLFNIIRILHKNNNALIVG